MFLMAFFQLLFLKGCVMPKGPLVNILLFTMLFYGAYSSFYYHHRRRVERVTIIESPLGRRQCDPLGSHLFVLAHYQTFLETITHAPSYVFPSLMDDIHIVGPMNEITCAFDHLLIQLTLVGLKVKVLNYKLWSPLGIFPSIEILQGCILVINGLCILGMLMNS